MSFGTIDDFDISRALHERYEQVRKHLVALHWGRPGASVRHSDIMAFIDDAIGAAFADDEPDDGSHLVHVDSATEAEMEAAYLAGLLQRLIDNQDDYLHDMNWAVEIDAIVEEARTHLRPGFQVKHVPTELASSGADEEAVRQNLMDVLETYGVKWLR